MLVQLLVIAFVVMIGQYNGNAEDNSPIFSSPPSELPVRKIYIHNRPVYVRQMFVSPQRRQINSPDIGSRSLRIKRLGFAPPVVPPIAAPAAAAYAAAPAFSYASAPAFAPQTAQAPFVAPQSAPAPFVPPPPQPPVFVPPPPPAPLPQPPFIPPPSPPTPPPPNYPLPQCYTDSSNFMCCNATLENVISKSFDELRNRPGWTSCNIHQISVKVQQNAEAMFGTNFEVITGVGDYASKSHFYSDLICKVEMDGKFILAYASPKPDADYDDADANGNGNDADNGNYNERPPARPPSDSQSYIPGNNENSVGDYGSTPTPSDQSYGSAGNKNSEGGYNGNSPDQSYGNNKASSGGYDSPAPSPPDQSYGNNKASSGSNGGYHFVHRNHAWRA